MFGLFRKAETRAAEVDIGALYASFYRFGGSSYAWQQSPAVLAASLAAPDSSGALLTEARRLARVSPLLVSYQRVMVGGITTGEPERPEFAEGVPERVATAAADLWEARHDCEFERDLLLRVMIDGEALLLDDGQVIPADGFEPALSGPEWARTVSGYKIGKSPTVRRGGFLYVGDRRHGEARALPWTAHALPYAAAVAGSRISAGHGIAALARLASTIKNTSPDRITAGAGHRAGVVETATRTAAGDVPITSTGVGSVVYLRAGEEFGRAMAGPDAVAQAYEGLLEADTAAALNLPLNELKSDYSSGSFSNLRMSWQDASREYERRRLWWHRRFRVPVWHAVLADAFADGRLPRMRVEDMAAIKRPTWTGPRREPPQPEKEAQALALLTDKGIYTPAQALAKLET